MVAFAREHPGGASFARRHGAESRAVFLGGLVEHARHLALVEHHALEEVDQPAERNARKSRCRRGVLGGRGLPDPFDLRRIGRDVDDGRVTLFVWACALSA